MFMELFYEDCSCGSYWENNISLPYAIQIPDKEDRLVIEEILNEDGFKCAVHENGYPVMYVNFTLRRYGRSVKPCKSSCINEKLLTKEQFLNNIYKRFKEDPSFQKSLCSNYAESARISLALVEKELQDNLAQGRTSERYLKFTNDSIARYKKQLAEADLQQESQAENHGTPKTEATSLEIVRITAVRFLQWYNNPNNQSYPHFFTTGKRADKSFYFRNKYTEIPNEFHLYPLTYPEKLFCKTKAAFVALLNEPKPVNNPNAKETWVFSVDYDDGSKEDYEFKNMDVCLHFSDYNDFLAYGDFFGEHDSVLQYPANLTIDDVRGEINAGWVPFERFYEHRIKLIIGHDDGIESDVLFHGDGSVSIDKLVLAQRQKDVVTIDTNGMIQNTGEIPYTQILKDNAVRVLKDKPGTDKVNQAR